MKAWFDGKFVEWSDATAPVLSHGFSRGSAIYEVLDIVMTDQGPAYFALDEHIERFYTSAELLRMKLPFTREELKRACLNCAGANRVRRGGAKFYAYYSEMEFGEVPQSNKISMVIFCWDFARLGMSQEELSKPISVGISSYRKLHRDTVPVHAKVAGNYINGYLALREVRERGYDDALLLDSGGMVAEAPTASVCFIKDGNILVPPYDNVLKGITRIAVERLACQMNIGMETRHISPKELAGMDEAFYAVSLKIIVPVKEIEGSKFLKGCPGPITRKLILGMENVYAGLNSEFRDWISII